MTAIVTAFVRIYSPSYLSGTSAPENISQTVSNEHLYSPTAEITIIQYSTTRKGYDNAKNTKK